MARFAASVSIVTTAGAAGRCGLTVSSVTSVSDDPPVVLVCVNRNARTCGLILRNGAFSVNLLKPGAEQLADTFAGRFDKSVDERFAMVEWDDGHPEVGVPVLSNAQVTLECAVSDTKNTGTHTVFFGDVRNIGIGNANGSLIYLNRKYQTLQL